MTLSELRFDIDWQGGDESIRSPELRATWARLGVTVGDETVTLVEDTSNSSLRRAIHVSLYPLAEWIATNWWTLRFDSRSHRGRSIDQRLLRSGAADGFLWPNLLIRPEGGTVDLTWWSDRRSGKETVVRYLSRGRATADGAQAQRALSSLVDATVDRLLEAGIKDTFLQEEWKRTNSVDREEAEFCEAAARLGLDPFTADVGLADLLDSVVQEIGGELAAEFFDAVELDHMSAMLDWVRAVGASGPAAPAQHPLDVDSLREAVPFKRSGRDGQPWLDGWSAARRARAAIGLEPSVPVVGDLVPTQVLNVAARQSITGIARDDGLNPQLVLARDYSKQSKRFQAARALWHAIGGTAGSSHLLTNAGTTSQRVGRAFAAEFLVPAAGLAEFLEGDYSEEAVEDAAEHFGAPSDVVLHQVENQLLAVA